MKIILGSQNPSKRRSLELALSELQINDVEIICLDSKFDVNSKPIGYEIIRDYMKMNTFMLLHMT